MANVTSPRRRIAPIPVVPSAPAVDPASPAAEQLPSNGAKSGQAPAERSPDAPGRRIHVDLSKSAFVSYTKLLRELYPDSGSEAEEGEGAAEEGTPAKETKPAPPPIVNPDSRRKNLFTDVIRKIEMRCRDGEITPSEGSSDDYMSDESGQGEGEEEECEASDMGGDSEGDEGEDGDASSEGTETDSDADDPAAAGAGAKDGAGGKAAKGTKAGAADAALVKPKAVRVERYEADFIDDDEVKRVKRKGLRSVVEGFFINQGEVQTVQIEQPPAPKRQAGARGPTPAPAEAAAAQQPAAAAAPAEAPAGRAGKGKRARDDGGDAVAGVHKPKQTKQQKTGKGAAAAAGGDKAQQGAGAAAGAEGAAKQRPPAGAVAKLSLAQMAAQAGKKAITQSGAPLRNVQNQQPATDAPGAGPADKKQTKKQQAAAKTQPAAADDTNANPADAQANNKAGAAGAKQRPKQGVAKILDKLKAKLQSSLPPTDPTAAAPKPLKLHALRSQLMNIALTCLSEHLGLSEGQAPTAGRLVCADDSVWRAELKGYADELLSEGRGAALPGQDSESVCAEMVRLAGDHLAEVNRHVESATDFVQRAQRAMGDDATATESLGVDTCAALHKAVESSRKVLSPSVARDWVIRSVHTAQDKGQGVHVFSVEFLDTELTAYTTSLKAAGKGAAGAGPAGAGGDGEGQAAEDAAVGPSKGALASPPVRAQNKGGAKAKDKERAADPPAQPSPGAEGDEEPSQPQVNPTQGATQQPTQQGPGYKLDLSPEEESELYKVAQQHCVRQGGDLTLLAQDWETAPHSHGKAMLTALLIHGPEGAANRHLNDTLRTHALIPGWAATATKACTDRVARVMSNKVMKGLVEPVGGNKYAWRHMPGITIVPRKTKAGGEGEGDGGEEEAA